MQLRLLAKVPNLNLRLDEGLFWIEKRTTDDPGSIRDISGRHDLELLKPSPLIRCSGTGWRRSRVSEGDVELKAVTERSHNIRNDMHGVDSLVLSRSSIVLVRRAMRNEIPRV